ncbi:MAG: hypothetical protein IPP31_12115 [Chitinophagaceae bacterium]|nr:hypothetical protein [Chitinophagaceae bacterium]
MALPRKLTAAEKVNFHNDFPLLDVDFTIVTDEPSGIYNCISWTVGVTNFWHWPGSLLSDFDNFYNQFGYTRRTKGTIAAWGHADSNMTHGCVSGPTHGPCWESKCGSWARIQHCLNELNGPVYGHVIAYYGWKRIIIKPQFPKYFLKYIMEKREYSREELALLKKLSSGIPAETRQEFEKRFKAWKNSWMKGSLSSVSDPYARTKNAEFRELASLGKSIVPLLAGKLTDESNFLALPAFEQLAGKRFTIRIDSTDERIQEGEQGRAYRTVKHYLANQ